MDIIRKRQLEKTLRTQSTGVGVRLPSLKKKKDKSDEKTDHRISCFKCQYFKITGIVSTPYACGAYGFMDKQMPSLVVFNTTGEHCTLFLAKNS
jgi:hypothetical protein